MAERFHSKMHFEKTSKKKQCDSVSYAIIVKVLLNHVLQDDNLFLRSDNMLSFEIQKKKRKKNCENYGVSKQEFLKTYSLTKWFSFRMELKKGDL